MRRTVLDAPGMEHTPTSEAVPLNQAARSLRVPARWLREEVEAGRLPALVAGTRILVHVPTVAARLAERAKAEPSAAKSGGAA